MSPYSITRANAARDLDAVRRAIHQSPLTVEQYNALTDLADSIEEQMVEEPAEFGSAVRAGIDGLSDRVVWVRSASRYWFSEGSRRAEWSDFHHPEVLRIGVGEASDGAALPVRRDGEPLAAAPSPMTDDEVEGLVDELAARYGSVHVRENVLRDLRQIAARVRNPNLTASMFRSDPDLSDDGPFCVGGNSDSAAHKRECPACRPRTAADLSALSMRTHQERRGARFCTLTPGCRMADGHTDGCRP